MVSPAEGDPPIKHDLTWKNWASAFFDPSTCLEKGFCEVSKTRSHWSHRLYYEVHGQESLDEEEDIISIVFIQGLNTSSFAWHPQAEHFGKLPGYRCLFFDNRAVGLSDSPLCRFSTQDMAWDTQELLEFLGWTDERSVHVVGVSMGGMIAQELALITPDTIASLTLISTTAGNGSAAPLSGFTMFARLMFVRTAEAMVDVVLDGLFPTSYLEDFSGGVRNRERLQREFLRRYSLTRKQTLSGNFLQTLAAVCHHLSPPRLTQLKNSIPKIAIISGDLDTAVKPQRSQDLHKHIPDSEFILFEGGGHALQWQFASRLNETIERVASEGAQSCKGRHRQVGLGLKRSISAESDSGCSVNHSRQSSLSLDEQ